LHDFAMIVGGLASLINDMKMDMVKVPELSRKLSTAALTAKTLPSRDPAGNNDGLPCDQRKLSALLSLIFNSANSQAIERTQKSTPEKRLGTTFCR
jgi:hypothetical protein